MNLKRKNYSLNEAFGIGLPRDQHVTGYEPSSCPYVPNRDPHYKWDRATLRDLIVWWQEGGRDAIYLFGPTGAGKSSALRNFCAALKIPMYEKTLHAAVEFEQLVTVVDLNDGSTVTSYSFLPLAMGAEGWPGIFVANELDRADPGAVVGMNEILEGQPLLVHLGGLDPVVPAPGFRIAATGNSAMMGDMQGGFVTVRQQDMACADRYWMCKVSYPEAAIEKEVLESVVPGLDPMIRSKIIEAANDIRLAFMGEHEKCQQLPITMSTRALKRWAHLTYCFRGAQSAALNPIAYALDRALLYRVDGMPEVRLAILTLVEGRLGDSFGKFV
jgi:cobaltochelatase CobS